MIIKEALQEGIKSLKGADIETPVVEAGVILCHVLDCDRSWLYTHNDYMLQSKQAEEFLHKLNLRAIGTPVQYITGNQEFMSLNFRVTPDVLIPRHDTEVLVEAVIENVSHMPMVRILDIGTGSGCVAISLAYYLKNCEVVAVDVSHGALELAKLNAEIIGVGRKINFVCLNVFDKMDLLISEDNKFDVIVSNPPYIPTCEISRLQREVKDYEPVRALDGGSDGLEFYRRIVDISRTYLKTEGLLAFEVGYNQAESVRGIMSRDFEKISFIKDVASIDRVVTGKLK
ncbi:MAG: peptide chain release factor N(5)-glutamine methyltransferase [Clostridia bacterium]|nr:peptide chain release factor N(5)-glutamine methyltransferase [Clostridia bacterium]